MFNVNDKSNDHTQSNFDLDAAVQQWCELVLSNDSIKNKNIDELKDHLYCVIEQFTAQGESDKQAFKQAIANMGEVDLLAGEYDKNRTFLNKLCAFEYGTIADKASQPNNVKSLIIQQSILWAAAMIAISLILNDKQQAMSVIFTVLVPLSLVNIISLKKNTAAKEYRCIKNKLSSWFN